MSKAEKKVVIVGGGPGGLFASNLLLRSGYKVDLYDRMSNVGKKFLVAGYGGLNLTHSEDLGSFADRYGKHREKFKSYLSDFSPENLRDWCHELGIETFIGSTGRVFPTKLKAGEMLIKWVAKLKSQEGFTLHTNKKLTGIERSSLTFDNEEKVQVSNVIFSLGGASWTRTGSDGHWKTMFEKLGVSLSPFKPMNSGFECQWSEHLIKKLDNTPLKNIALTLRDLTIKNELMLTPYGVEGGGIYSLSRELMQTSGKATLFIDLLPDLSQKQILEKLDKPRGKNSLSNHLRKILNLEGAKFVLLKEKASSEELQDNAKLAFAIKNLRLELSGPRPIDEAISTIGGVKFENLDENLMLESIPGFYVIGEMLDWEAPTGGYLLQGCFSTAFAAVKGITENK